MGESRDVALQEIGERLQESRRGGGGACRGKCEGPLVAGAGVFGLLVLVERPAEADGVRPDHFRHVVEEVVVPVVVAVGPVAGDRSAAGEGEGRHQRERDGEGKLRLDVGGSIGVDVAGGVAQDCAPGEAVPGVVQPGGRERRGCMDVEIAAGRVG